VDRSPGSLLAARRPFATVTWSYVSITDQVMLEARGLLHAGLSPAETAPGGHLEALPFESNRPEVFALYSCFSHSGTLITDALSAFLRKGTPRRSPDGLARLRVVLAE
jgi:hypothetical protein